MQSLRSWFGGGGGGAVPSAPTPSPAAATLPSTPASASSCSPLLHFSAESSALSSPAFSSAAAGFEIVEHRAACNDETHARSHAISAVVEEQPQHPVAAPSHAVVKRSWRDALADGNARSGFAFSSAAHYAAAAESDEACSAAIPALAPLLRSSSSMSSDVSLISGRSVSPFTLSSSDDFRSDDDDHDDGQFVADLLAVDSAAGDLADSLLFDLAEETDEGEDTEAEDETAEHVAAHTADGSCRECMEHAAFEAAEAQYESSLVGRADFKLRPAVYDWHGKLAREVSFPFGKAHGQRLPREQQAFTRKKRELARWPKLAQKLPHSYRPVSSHSLLALQRSARTCDDCAFSGQNNGNIYQRQGCNHTLTRARAIEMQRRAHQQLSARIRPPTHPSLAQPLEVSHRRVAEPEVTLPYEERGAQWSLRRDIAHEDDAFLKRSDGKRARVPQLTEAAWPQDPAPAAIEKLAKIKHQRAATRQLIRQADAARENRIPKHARLTSVPPAPKDRLPAYVFRCYPTAAGATLTLPFEQLRAHWFEQMQRQGVVESLRSTPNAHLRPMAVRLAPVSAALVAQFMAERAKWRQFQSIELCYALASDDTIAQAPQRAWRSIHSAATAPTAVFDAPFTTAADPNARRMLVCLSISCVRYDPSCPAWSPWLGPIVRVPGRHHQIPAHFHGRLRGPSEHADPARAILPLFVIDYAVLPTPLGLEPQAEPISKRLAQKVLSRVQGQRRVKRRLHVDAPVSGTVYTLAPRARLPDEGCHCCNMHQSPDTGEWEPVADAIFARMRRDAATHRVKCDELRMESARLERNLIVQSQPVAPTYDGRRFPAFRHIAEIDDD